MRRDTSNYMLKCADCEKKHGVMLLKEKHRKIFVRIDEKRWQMKETMDDAQYKLLLKNTRVIKRYLRLHLFLGIWAYEHIFREERHMGFCTAIGKV